MNEATAHLALAQAVRALGGAAFPDRLLAALRSLTGRSNSPTSVDDGVLYDFAKQNPTTKVATEFATGEHYGFNMAKDNTALLTVVNEVLKTAKSDGTYNDIYKKWFGTDAPKE